jgi:sugar/nucleoside kinase (ribokinase family)
METFQPFDCTVIGDVLIDLIFYVNDDHPRFSHGGTSYCDNAKIEFGGSGNIAVGLSSLGGKAAFVGKAGNDSLGKLYMKNLKDKNIVPKIFFDKDISTGMLIAFVDNHKERSFLVFRGANNKLSTDEISKASVLIKKSKCIYFSGYSLVEDPQQTAILRGIELAKKYNAKVVFDPGAYNLIQSKPKLFAKIISLSDVFSLNLDEAIAITDSTNINDVINKFKNEVPLTALKCGSNGCIFISKNDVLKIPGIKVKCTDPTGAGDAFTAALIYGLVRRYPLKQIGKLANWFAAQKVSQIGPRSFPIKTRINNFLANL